MLKTSWVIAAAALLTTAGCLQNDAERAIVGAGAGCVAGEVINGDCTTGALGGAVIGALSDDL